MPHFLPSFPHSHSFPWCFVGVTLLRPGIYVTLSPVLTPPGSVAEAPVQGDRCSFIRPGFNGTAHIPGEAYPSVRPTRFLLPE